MKKSVLLSLIFSASICFTACKSTEEPVKKNVEEKRSYIGWADASSKDLSVQKGIIDFTVKPNLGSYNIGVINTKDKVIPIFSTVDEYTSSAFYLKTTKKTYKLISDYNMKAGVSKTSKGIAITYVIPDVAEIKVDLAGIQSSSNNDVDIVKTTVTVKNVGPRKDTFALKQIIDTVLGESSENHFYTSDNIPVKNEMMFRNIADQKWILSKNNNAAAQFLFNGADSTVPEFLALANYSTLAKNAWEPDMLTFRTFDSVLAYNNSGVCVVWPEVKLMPKESSKVVYYTALAYDSELPCGEAYIYGNAKEAEKNVVPEVVEPVVKEPELPPAPVVEKKVLPVVEKDVYAPKEVSNVEFNVNSITREQYSPEYIQKLLDRIAVLERDSSAVNREELLRLNAELDAILSSLR